MNIVYLPLVRNLLQGVISAWYYPMLSRCWWLVAFTRLRGFFIGVWYITLLVEHPILVFLIFSRCMFQHLWYLIDSLLSTSAQDILGMQYYFFNYNFLEIPSALTWCALGVPWFTQINFMYTLFSIFYLFLVMLFLAYPCIYLARLIIVFLVAPYCAYLIKYMLELLKALAELGRIDFPDISLLYYCHTSCIGRRSCQTTALLLFEWEMSLVLPLLCIGGGGKIKF